ncbi:unnamed protein product [Urochloa humidicola]
MAGSRGEEYLRNGVVTSGMPLALSHVLFLLGHDQAAYNEATKLSDHIPPAISCREWEELNRECFCRRTFSDSFSQACLNAARMISVIYSYDKEKRLLALEDYARMLLLL